VVKAVARAGGRTGDRGKGGYGGKAGGNNEKTAAPVPTKALVRRLHAAQWGILSDSWGNSSNEKIGILSALPRIFCTGFFAQDSFPYCIRQGIGNFRAVDGFKVGLSGS